MTPFVKKTAESGIRFRIEYIWEFSLRNYSFKICTCVSTRVGYDLTVEFRRNGAVVYVDSARVDLGGKLIDLSGIYLRYEA
jgi:hypothetical protein